MGKTVQSKRQRKLAPVATFDAAALNCGHFHSRRCCCCRFKREDGGGDAGGGTTGGVVNIRVELLLADAVELIQTLGIPRDVTALAEAVSDADRTPTKASTDDGTAITSNSGRARANQAFIIVTKVLWNTVERT